MTSPVLWSRPFSSDRWLRDFFSPTTVSDWLLPTPAGFSPAAEITKDGDDAVVRLELPGVDVDKDVTIELQGGHLTIRGERRDEHSSDESGRTLHEVRYGSFSRSFAVPAHVTGDAISAKYDAGVLTVRVAGAYAGTKPQQIAIDK